MDEGSSKKRTVEVVDFIPERLPCWLQPQHQAEAATSSASNEGDSYIQVCRTAYLIIVLGCKTCTLIG